MNLSDAQFVYEPDDPDGFRSGSARLGPDLGAQRTGMTVYELPSGQALCPYHYEHAEEEWLLVLTGAPTLRTPAGERVLAPFDVAFFTNGPEGAHGIRNETSETVRVVMFSDVIYPAVTVYPDSDKIGVFTRDRQDNVMVERSSGVDYFHGEDRAG